MNETLVSAALKFGIEISREMESAFCKYADILIETNKVMNLTAITDIDEIFSKHFIDSISCQSLIPQNSLVVDIGSGAGFPGIPLKIVRPDLNMTLVDSLKKRVDFLKKVINLLEIDNAEAIHIRAEDAGRNKKLREKFDVAAARAVAPLCVLCEYCLPFVKVGGLFLALKGREAEREAEKSMKAINALGGELSEIKNTFFGELEHRVVVIKKVCKTPSQYPRKAGNPSKEPII